MMWQSAGVTGRSVIADGSSLIAKRRGREFMNIYYIRQFWFDDFYDDSGDVQRAYLTWNDFQQQNIKIAAHLNVVTPGAHIEIDQNTVKGNIGFAAVGIKSYDYIDDAGNLQHVDNSYFVPHATIRRCMRVQLELAYARILAGASGAIYYFTD
jgi:hypothetical protein